MQCLHFILPPWVRTGPPLSSSCCDSLRKVSMVCLTFDMHGGHMSPEARTWAVQAKEADSGSRVWPGANFLVTDEYSLDVKHNFSLMWIHSVSWRIVWNIKTASMCLTLGKAINGPQVRTDLFLSGTRKLVDFSSFLIFRIFSIMEKKNQKNNCFLML